MSAIVFPKLQSLQQDKVIERQRRYNRVLRRQFCPHHDQKIIYKCEHPDCLKPYMCKDQDCFDSHFHDERLTVSRFSNAKLKNQLERVHKIIKNSGNVRERARSIKIVIDSHKGGLVDLFHEKDEFSKLCESGKEGSQQVLTIDKVRKIQQIGDIQKKLWANIAAFQSRFSLPKPHVYSQQVTNFLTLNIKHFAWSNSKQLWDNSQQPSMLPALLSHKEKLLFLMIGEKKAIGSYFPCKYPSLEEQMAKVPGSFIFLQDDKEQDKFLKFTALQSAEHHVRISEKQLICQGNSPSVGDGLRPQGPSLSTISYYLPTASYQMVQQDPQNDYICYSSQFRAKHVLIYQLTHED